ncbi:UNVERIFIED_CONTAM: hypothetical protein Slati_3700300 [Sesamum latifolium]|uniref:Uncharacterized protein n=1 Tax=Sesamum latifolium TaxID=2727402 RepID=A0AAW2U5U2_9LAMI
MRKRGTVWLAVRSKRLLPPNSNNNNPPTLAQRADRNSNTVRNSSNNNKRPTPKTLRLRKPSVCRRRWSARLSGCAAECASRVPSAWAALDTVGGGVVVNSIRKGSLVKIGDVNLPVDLIVMDLKEFDVILGMDWLAQHRAVVDCYKKEVMIESSGESRVVFVGDRQVVSVCVISAVEARRLMLEGCEAYLAHVIDTKKVNPTLEEIP